MPLAFFLFCLCVEDVCFSCTQLKLKTHSYSLKIWRQALDYIYHHSFKKIIWQSPKNTLSSLRKQDLHWKISGTEYQSLHCLSFQRNSDVCWQTLKIWVWFFSPAFASNNCLCWVLGRILIIMASNELFHALWFPLECNNQYYFSCGAMMQKCQKPEPIGPKMKKLVLSWDILTMVMQLG